MSSDSDGKASRRWGIGLYSSTGSPYALDMDSQQFDAIAEAELRALDGALGDFDPDEVEAEPTPGVLTLTLANGDKIIINSHRAAGEIWMAAFRNAWHFAPKLEGERWMWRTPKDELRTTLGRLLSERLGRTVAI